MDRKKYLFLWAVALFLWAVSSRALAETEGLPGPDDARSRAFARIEATASTLTTISSDFSQEKHLSMLKDPLRSKGRFFYEKPDRLYWEIVKPSPAGFMVTGTRAKRWGKDPGSTERFEIDRDPVARAIVEQVCAWARADFPWLEKRYVISVKDGGHCSLKLVPRSSRERRYLSHLIITFSGNWGHVSSVEIHEEGGDFTSILFQNPLINHDIPEGIFPQQ